jgi:signal peptidase I
MPSHKSEKTNIEKPTHKKKDRAEEIANTFEWLITAFILAFVFRAFVMEAFRIPTGSMADTLKGAHFSLRCRQCGYKYDHGFVPGNYNMPEDTIPYGSAPVPVTRCPSCGYYRSRREARSVSNGDRILVLKCLYQFLGPKHWDVIVFKNPLDPTVNYIKRLIGLPGEQVQIIDGDIYINGQISRKPPKVQNELWMPVYDNDFQPVDRSAPIYNGKQWKHPFKHSSYSRWRIDESNPTMFFMDSSVNEISSLMYDTSIGNDFRAIYSYNSVNGYKDMSYCSDLMVRFYCLADNPQGRIGIALSKYETTYKAEIHFSSGTMHISKQKEGQKPIELTGISIRQPAMNKLTPVKFANVDHQLIFEYGSTKYTHDLGRNLEDTGEIKADIQPRVEIFGSGKLTLSHVAIFRDIHYTTARYGNSGSHGRATDNPFTLGEDEFFVLGDNSPNSEDGRWWSRQGLTNPGLPPYRAGIVPRDYLVGKALFVYWPSGFRPFPKFPFGIIPNVGQMRFIFGGSSKEN